MGLNYTGEGIMRQIMDKPYGYLNVYDVTLGYGGPEEGGWWFDVYTPIASVKYFNSGDALKGFDLFEDLYKETYEDSPSRSSTSSQAGDLVIMVEGHTAEFKPDKKPHYE